MHPDGFTRFTLSLQQWFQAHAPLVTALGAGGAGRILVTDRNIDVTNLRPCVVIYVETNNLYFADVDSVWGATVYHDAITTSRATALTIGAHVHTRLEQQKTPTVKDAGFKLNHIQAKAKIIGQPSFGELVEFSAPASLRRTERSDAPVADKFFARVEAMYRWQDTKPVT